MLTLELVVTAVVKTVVKTVVTALLSLVLVVRALVALDVFDGGICIFRGGGVDQSSCVNAIAMLIEVKRGLKIWGGME